MNCINPPPYVPEEYRKCKYSEIPEPYKSNIDAWIEHTNRHYERRTLAAKQGVIVAMVIIVAIVAIALGAC